MEDVLVLFCLQRHKRKHLFVVMAFFFLLSSLASSTSQEGHALMEIKASFSNIADVVLDWDDVHNDDLCSWRGVYCDNLTLTVLTLNLSSLNLDGEISPAIGDLRNMESIICRDLS